MRLLHELAKIDVTFDDPRLVSRAGLVPVMARDPAKSFMRSEAALVCAAGLGRGAGWRRRCWWGRPGAAG